MTFSPEDNFGSVPPPPAETEDDFDAKWGTGELSLEGDETASAETPAVETAPEPTLEELGERYRVRAATSTEDFMEANPETGTETTGDKVEEQESPKTPEEAVDRYIEEFKELRDKTGEYGFAFNALFRDEIVDFYNNSGMVVRFIKGMGDFDSVRRVNALFDLAPGGVMKKLSKENFLDIMGSIPESASPYESQDDYNELLLLARKSGLERDQEVLKEILRKNRYLASKSMGFNDAEIDKIITEGPDQHFA